MRDRAEILVVDDTPANLEVITETLSRAGYTVAAVTNGKRALKRLKTYIPDLILLDVRMPDMDGFETCRRIKANPDTANVPVVFITVASDTENLTEGFSRGAVDYITKPFQEPELLARIKTHLKLQFLTQSLEQRVAERTAELQSALEQLHQSQRQLTQLNHELEQANQQLEDYSQTLEQKVVARTAELQEREARYRALMDGASDGIFLADRQGNIREVNHQAEALLGYTRSELTAMHFTQLHRPQDLSSASAAFDQGTNQQVSQMLDVSFRCKDGQIVPVDISTSVVEIQGETTIQGIFRDITDRKRAEAQIRQYTLELENSNRELESFAYSVSHDLRTPLRHIHGFVNALRQQLEQDGAIANPKVTHYLKTIDGSSRKMGQLIDGLLTLSRIGRKPMDYKSVNVEALVREAISLVSGDHPPSTLAEFIIGDLPTVRGDAVLLQQVFSNLIGNAVKFSRPKSSPQITIGSLSDGSIFVRDNGVGFDMSHADQLFGAFQRLHSQREFEGTGIGLAIVQRIVHRHGGRIWAEAEPGRGSAFYFTLQPTPSH